MGEARHLRLVGVADEQRRPACQQHHGDDGGIAGDAARRVDDVAQAADGALRLGGVGGRGAGRRFASVRALQPPQHGQVDECVDDDAKRGTEGVQQSGADGRTGHHAEVTPGGAQAHRTGQQFSADQIVHEHLAWRQPQHARHAMQHQQYGGMPGLQQAGVDEQAPCHGHGHEQQHAGLDDATRVDAVGQRADMHREQQVGHPVRDDRESAQRRRAELLEHDPVADHMLDVVGHHGQHVAEQEAAVMGLAQRGEGSGVRGQGRWVLVSVRRTQHRGDVRAERVMSSGNPCRCPSGGHLRAMPWPEKSFSVEWISLPQVVSRRPCGRLSRPENPSCRPRRRCGAGWRRR